MKVNKYIIGMFVATATLFVSCNTDNEGDIYNGTTMGVTFATGTQSVSFLPQDMRVLMWKSYARNLRKLLQLIYQQH